MCPLHICSTILSNSKRIMQRIIRSCGRVDLLESKRIMISIQLLDSNPHLDSMLLLLLLLLFARLYHWPRSFQTLPLRAKISRATSAQCLKQKYDTVCSFIPAVVAPVSADCLALGRSVFKVPNKEQHHDAGGAINFVFETDQSACF